MIVAATEREAIFGPNDLSADVEVGGLKGLLDFTGVQACMPDIGNRTRKKRPGFSPVVTVVVGHLAEFQRVEVDTGSLSPSRVIAHAVRRIGDHQMWLDATQQLLNIVRGGAVTA
jgi:hypothetical protein